MARLLSDDDIEAIAAKLTSYSGLSAEEHREQHEDLRIFLEAYKAKKEFWLKIQQQVGGWGIIAVLGIIGTTVWHGVIWAVENTKH
jgi:hypothetical protein